MTEVLSWMFRRRQKRKLLELQEKARQDPQNCQAQVRLGDLLIKMGNKKAAIEAYHLAAERFAQQGFMIEAVAISKIIMRLDPLEREIPERVSRLYTEWETLKRKKRIRKCPGGNQELRGGYLAAKGRNHSVVLRPEMRIHQEQERPIF